jgi:hypothetical protein
MDRSISGSHSLRETKFPAAKHAQMASLRLPWVCRDLRGAAWPQSRLVVLLRMRERQRWHLGPGINVVEAELLAERWVVTAEMPGSSRCPDCGVGAAGRHGTSVRRLQDLPVQGRPVEVQLRTTRLRCWNASCRRRTFTAWAEWRDGDVKTKPANVRPSAIGSPVSPGPSARRTCRVADRAMRQSDNEVERIRLQFIPRRLAAEARTLLA